MADYVADDASLAHLKIKRLTVDELPERLLLPDVLDIETVRQYKQFYEKCPTDPLSPCLRPLLVPTRACTMKDPRDLCKREALFLAAFPDDSFVHPEFENVRGLFKLRSEEDLDMEMFKKCAHSLPANDPAVVPRAAEVFRAFSNTLPNRVTDQHDTWRELDDIPFIPRRMRTVRKLSEKDKNESGLDIPPEVTRLEAIVSPLEVVKDEFEAIAWSQRACFDKQPNAKVYLEYPNFGTPNFSEVVRVLDHMHFGVRMLKL
jgi:sacsin